MASSRGRLSALQHDFLEEWFRRTSGFFLTGGAVLVGYLYAQRVTRDLDLFTLDPEALEDALRVLPAICAEMGVQFERLKTAPYFHRFLLSRGGEETLVDIVLESVPQIVPDKTVEEDGITIDIPEEILVNKICSIVGRSEARDFFDVHFLVRSGYDAEKALLQASLKDGGVDEEALLFVLSAIAWDSFTIPGCTRETTEEVRRFFEDWAESIALRLFPRSGG